MLRLELKNILKDSGLTVTKNRLRVLNVFLKMNKPLSANTIRLSLKDLDRVTLFRILSVFERSKLIHPINLDSGQRLYAMCSHQCNKSKNHIHDHIHFHCEKCDDVSCLSIDKFPTLSAPNYVFKNVNITVSGFCSDCS